MVEVASFFPLVLLLHRWGDEGDPNVTGREGEKTDLCCVWYS